MLEDTVLLLVVRPGFLLFLPKSTASINTDISDFRRGQEFEAACMLDGEIVLY